MKKILTLALVLFLLYAGKADAQQTPIKSVNTTFLFGDRLINCQLVKNLNSYDIKLYDQKYGFKDSLVNTYVLNQLVFDNFCSNFFTDCKGDKIDKAIIGNKKSRDTEESKIRTLKADTASLNDSLESIKTNLKEAKNKVDSLRLENKQKKLIDSLSELTDNLKASYLNLQSLQLDSSTLSTGKSNLSTHFAEQLSFFKQYVSPTIYQDLYTQLLTDPDAELNIAQIKVAKTIPLYLYYSNESKLQKRYSRDYWNDSIKALKFSMDSIKKTYTSKKNTIAKNHSNNEAKPDVRNKIYPKTTFKYKISLTDYKNQKKAIKKQSKKKLYLDPKIISQAIILNSQFVFKDGFIEQILIQARVNKVDTRSGLLKEDEYEIITFGNTYSIGISTFRNIKDLENIYLFEEEKKTFRGSRVITLGDLIDYTKILQEDTRDYSPQNQKATFYPDTLYTLSKEKTSKLLEFRVYTDLAGIEETNPNGLIQTELAKRIVTNAKRIRIFRKYGFSWGTYIEPIFTLSKIENKFKYLTPDTTTGTNGKVEKFSSPLKLYQYQFLQVGSRVNLLYLENRINIYDIYLNGFFNFGLTKFRDTIATDIQKNLTTLTTGFELGICFYPEKRYSFGIHDRVGIQLPLFGDVAYYSVKNYVNETGSNPDKWINTIEIHGHIYTSDRGKIFARFRFNSQFTDWRNNFSQFQIGYSIYLLDRNK